MTDTGPNPDPAEPSRLIAALSDGTLDEEGGRRLDGLLKADPTAQQAYLDHMALDGLLQWEFGGAAAAVPSALRPAETGPREPPEPLRPRLRRFVAAAAQVAAGLVFGVLTTSLVLGYAAVADRPAETPLPLAEGGFEAGVPPASDGLPTAPGVWGGDFAGIVGAERGVAPRGGKRMLRFLRSDFRGERSPVSYVGNLYQIVDLRPWRAELADGRASAELAAWFNGVAATDGEGYFAGVHVYALAGDPAAPHPPGQRPADRCLATGGRQHVRIDDDPATWQRVAAGMTVPPETDYLVVELQVARMHPGPGPEPVRFPGHYADDVSLTLTVNPAKTDKTAATAGRADR
jgi:hypothetical protein